MRSGIMSEQIHAMFHIISVLF